MLKALRRDEPSVGVVLYRGNLQPRAEEFDFLRREGIDVRPGRPVQGGWALELRHREWGAALLSAQEGMRPPPADYVEWSHGLTREEKEQIRGAGTAIGLRVPAKRGNVLADRKRMLRFMRAVMADDALAGLDTAATRFWTRDALDLELTHGADLDVGAVYTIHSVYDDAAPGEPEPYWVHTHGLAELGGFDFDILAPSADFIEAAGDGFLDALAYMVLSGDVQMDGPAVRFAMPDGVVRMVNATRFMTHARPEERKLREHDEEHGTKRAVVCDPSERAGFLGLGRRRPSASAFFRRFDGDRPAVVFFSDAVTEMMAERARATVPALLGVRAELPRICPTLLKLRYETDSGGAEHLWFEVQEMDGDTAEATLLNEPHDIRAMHAGERRRHSLARLTDWAVQTPAGQINPRDQRALRSMRMLPPELLAKLEEAGAGVGR